MLSWLFGRKDKNDLPEEGAAESEPSDLPPEAETEYTYALNRFQRADGSGGGFEITRLDSGQNLHWQLLPREEGFEVHDVMGTRDWLRT